MAPSEVEVVEADEGAPAGAWGGAEGEVVVTKHVNRRTNALTQRDEQLRAAGDTGDLRASMGEQDVGGCVDKGGVDEPARNELGIVRNWCAALLAALLLAAALAGGDAPMAPIRTPARVVCWPSGRKISRCQGSTAVGVRNVER